jgi:hypothetical protein
MRLIGRTLSPYVRRVAICLDLIGQPYENLSYALVVDAAAVRGFNPLGRGPSGRGFRRPTAVRPQPLHGVGTKPC